jgi:uncharacterized protein YjcR
VAEQEPLTADQIRAAALVGKEWPYKDVAAEIGVHAKTIMRWTKREDFQEVAGEVRKEKWDKDPEVMAVLNAALKATKANGEPDHRIRLDALRMKQGRRAISGGSGDSKARIRTIYAGEDEPNAGTDAS